MDPAGPFLPAGKAESEVLPSCICRHSKPSPQQEYSALRDRADRSPMEGAIENRPQASRTEGFMLKPLLLTAMAATLALTVSFADQPKGKLVIPAQRTDPTNGKMMFSSYCAPCHGADGRGNGPVAGALKDRPTDLTGLAKANHGKYPETHIVTVLRFGTDVRAHGAADMPVWGTVFGKMSKTNPQERDLRTANLSRYLETLQAR